MTLDADLGVRNRVATWVAEAPPNQRAATKCEGPLGFVIAREARGDRVATSDRRAGAEVVDEDVFRFAGGVGRPGLCVVQAPKRLISAAQVAETWGVERPWVYAHAKQLGARRLGAGKRPRLRFDPDEVAERIGALTGAASGDIRRSPGMAGDAENDSISRPSGAIVGEQNKSGRAARERPRPGAEAGTSAR